MDRRDFIKTMASVPLIAPLSRLSAAASKNEVFLIADRPDIYLPVLLDDLKTRIASLSQRLSFHVPPQENALAQALIRAGWTPAPSFQKAALNISFRGLRHPTPPSFTLVRDGRILDIRTKRLFSFWQQMNKTLPSSRLTIASLQTGPLRNVEGRTVRIYKEGRIVEEISLKKDALKNFPVKQGVLTVKIEQGKAFIPASPCRGKICCSVPPVSFSGERIVCAPNHFLLEVRGPGQIDTIIG
jgi:hypothetical protein